MTEITTKRLGADQRPPRNHAKNALDSLSASASQAFLLASRSSSVIIAAVLFLDTIRALPHIERRVGVPALAVTVTVFVTVAVVAAEHDDEPEPVAATAAGRAHNDMVHEPPHRPDACDASPPPPAHVIPH